jgi:exopolysaccharide biosynthesis polyprenyl glycosylphosphotransferase
MKKAELIFSAILVPVDYLMLILAAIAAYGFRFADFVAQIRPIVFTLPFNEYLFLALLIALGWLVIFAFFKLYAITGQRRLIDEIARIFVACSTSIAAVIIFIFFRRELFSSRFIVLAVWIFSFISVSLGRIIVRKIQRYFYKKNYGTHKVVVVGTDKSSDLIFKELNTDKSLGYEVVRRVDGFNEGVKKIFNQLQAEDKLDEVIAADVGLTKEEAKELISYCNQNHIGFKYVADIFRAQVANIEMGMIAGIPIIELKETKLEGWGRISKRFFDFIVSFVLIILLSPLLIIVAIIIKLSSKGPVFFSYQRVGEHSKKFKYFKFRSMKEGSHELRFDKEFQKKYGNLRAGTPMIKLKDDPRITRIGKFIRKYSIDELPELFNVFIGKMSLVGPRPHEIEEVAKYEKHHKKLLAIKPGMTGLAQISGRSDLDFEEEVKLDTFYIENWSMRLDLWILFKTPLVLLKKRKAL